MKHLKKGKTLLEVFRDEHLLDGDDIQPLDDEELAALEGMWKDQDDPDKPRKKGKKWKNTNATRKTRRK